MNQSPAPMAARHLGLYSALATVIFNVMSSVLMIASWYKTPVQSWSGIESYAAAFSEFQMLSMLPGFIVAMAFVPFAVSIHSIGAAKNASLTLTGALFAVAAAVLLGFQYYSQLTTVRQSIASGTLEGLGLFVVGNTNSFWWPIETLGYGFMGIASVFLSAAFSGSPRAVWIKILSMANGLISVSGLIAYPLGIGVSAILVSLTVWVILFPVLVILIAIEFRELPKAIK